MKKRVLVTCMILALSSQSGFATESRIAALGGEIAMITDDDTNIDIFPQTINRQNLFRISNISSNTPNFAVITGEKGDKWGLDGGSNQQNDFFNIYRSLGNNKAVKLGVAVGRYSEENIADNKEASPGNIKTTEKNSYFNLMIDADYGETKNNVEKAIYGVFSYGPNTIDAVTGSLLRDQFGTYANNNVTGATTTKQDGKGNKLLLGAAASLRKPMKIAVFNKVYASGSAYYSSDSASLSTGAVKNQDTSSSEIFLSGRVLMFDEKKVGNKSRVYYGLGGRASLTKTKTLDKVTSDENNETSLSISGPQFRMGAETALKHGVVRFGITRDFDLFSYNSKTQTPKIGAVNDANSQKILDIGIGTSGSYSVSTGFGLEYNDLKIDFILRNIFWLSGPQMIFDARNGTIATSASMLYVF